MNKSRFSLLLSIALFVAPAMVIADDVVNASTQTTEEAANGTSAADALVQELTIKLATDKAAVDVLAQELAADVVVTPETKAGIIAALTAFMAARRTNVYNSLDFVADYTVNPVFTKLATFECLKGGTFEKSIPTINKVVVSAAAIALVFAAYKAIETQNASEDFDGDFDDSDNN